MYHQAAEEPLSSSLSVRIGPGMCKRQTTRTMALMQPYLESSVLQASGAGTGNALDCARLLCLFTIPHGGRRA